MHIFISLNFIHTSIKFKNDFLRIEVLFFVSNGR